MNIHLLRNLSQGKVIYIYVLLVMMYLYRVKTWQTLPELEHALVNQLNLKNFGKTVWL